jgi:hypothetical protein
MTFYQGRNVAVLGAAQQIAFPMTRNCSIFDFRRPLADRDGLDDLTARVSEDRRVLRAAHAPLRPQVVHQLFFHYSKQFLVNAKEEDVTVLPALFLKRGDAYADMGDIVSANREYDRVVAGFPKWAENEFTTRNGKRIRVRQ